MFSCYYSQLMLLIVTAFAHSKSPSARRKCSKNSLYWVVNAQLMRISTVNSNVQLLFNLVNICQIYTQ